MKHETLENVDLASGFLEAETLTLAAFCSTLTGGPRRCGRCGNCSRRESSEQNRAGKDSRGLPTVIINPRSCRPGTWNSLGSSLCYEHGLIKIPIAESRTEVVQLSTRGPCHGRLCLSESRGFGSEQYLSVDEGSDSDHQGI